MGALRYSATLARVRETAGGPLVATRALFPGTVHAAVVQKARWITGIALAGWDRIGWGRALDWGEHWMRMRDRRAPIAVLVLATAYLSLIVYGASLLLHAATGRPVPTLDGGFALLLQVNAALLAWRLLVRATFTGHAYGWRQALLSLPRVVVGNAVALLAARRAVFGYVATLRGAPMRWDKTEHQFPDGLAAGDA